MPQLTPSTRLYPCRHVVRHNDDITLTYRDGILRATQTFFVAHHGGGAECEGVITHPPEFRGRHLHIDLLRDRSRGVFSLGGSTELDPADHFSVSVVWTVSRKVSCHLAWQGHYSARVLEIHTNQGIIYGSRNHEELWGPHIFRCLIGRYGPATIYVP